MVMTLLPPDWAAEWVRPTTPDFKMVGPVLTEPGKPLPTDLEVEEASSCPSPDCSCQEAIQTQRHWYTLSLADVACMVACFDIYWQAFANLMVYISVSEPACMQAFMTDCEAGKQGVLLASLGTIAELGEQCRTCHHHSALATVPLKTGAG